MSWQQNTEAERQALALILDHEPSRAMMLSILESDDFFTGIYRAVFEAARKIHHSGRAVDIVSVHGELQGAYGMGELCAIDDGVVPYPSKAQATVEELRSNRRLRRLVEIVDGAHQQITASGPADAIDADALLSDLEEQLASVRFIGATECDDSLTMLAKHNEDLCRSREDIEREYIRARQWGDFARYFPFERRALSGIAARPGGGKSAFMVNLLAQLATDGYKGMFFSIEMDRRAVCNRIMACVTGIEKRKFRFGELTSDDRGFAFEATARHAPNYQIRFQTKIRVSQIASDLYRFKAKNGLDFFVVDYLQIVDDSEYEYKKRYEAIGSICRGLRDLARQLDCAGIVGIQVGRDAEKSAGARHIRLSDFRESGNIENDLDAAVAMNLVECDDAIDNLEVEILKNREGVRGKTLRFTHRKDFNRLAETADFQELENRIMA